MDIVKTLELIEKYGSCQKCGNDTLGDGEGTISIEEDIFRRACKCGWSVKIKESE